jgi:Tol biopolymer transport system component
MKGWAWIASVVVASGAVARGLATHAEQPPPAVGGAAAGPTSSEFTPKLLLAFGAYHPRKQQPTIYFYQHDGESRGKLAGEVKSEPKRSDYHPSLSGDGRLCAFAAETENETSRIHVWDLIQQKLVELPDINKSPNAQLHASMGGGGKLVAFAAWRHPESDGRWDVLLYDVDGKRRLPLPGLNSQPLDERMPALSADGRVLAYCSNDKAGLGATDIFCYDIAAGQPLYDERLNSSRADIEPSLSADGNLVAFVSDRRGGEGGRDIYLYDRAAREFVSLPGLNSVAHEQSPSLSTDGRYIAFVSERSAGEGERDVFLYDRRTNKLLPTPGLNGKHEDFDPSLILLPPAP